MVVVVGSLAICVMAGLTTVVAIQRRNAELAAAARELRTLDLLIAEETDRSLQSVRLILDNIADQVAADGIATPDAFVEHESTKALHEILSARAAGAPQLDAITMVSAQGKLINFSRGWPIPDVDLSDRDYFRTLRDTRTDDPFLSAPVISRGSGTPTVYLVRRIGAPDGTFLGLALGAIELGYFDRLFASLRLEPGNLIALWRRDGVLLARYPPALIGQRIAPEAITSPMTSWHGVPRVFEKSWSLQGSEPGTRVVASQAAASFPVQVNVARSKSVILEDWRREVATVGGAVALAALCIAVLMWALLRRFQSYEAMERAGREREAAVNARQEAEDALRQAQKMEAIGQLTGGVAHDFNNLLTVVRSSVDLLRRPDLPEERRSRYVDAISEATDRAAKLTAQLLAFARRQTLKPEVFDVVANVVGTGDMIQRLTGSRLQLHTVLPDGPCFVEADPNQFDTALVNLAVNGRDAMAQGGRLTLCVRAVDQIPAIRARAAVSGSYVAVSVSDTGAGIAPEMLDRVFEPFFTTKKVGEGTGLGLSQVFGFVKQSGGDVHVASDAASGTTVTLYLPRVEASRAVREPTLPILRRRPTGRSARVLVVEDNEQVARSTTQTLAALGFETIWAGDGPQALAALEAGAGGIDAVFSDVVMPGMSGIDLGRIVRQRFPAIPVILASGYSHVLAEQGSDGFPVLQKPYATEELARALDVATAGAPEREPRRRARA